VTEEEFATLPLQAKWSHLNKTMHYILVMDSQYISKENNFSLRRRYNTHHSDEQIAEEKGILKRDQRNLRIDQYQRWRHVKDLYAAHRDEMMNTMGEPEYEESKSILERIFTMELDDALRDVIDE
jgi:hypothetical protein